jgi:hypothetical protein
MEPYPYTDALGRAWHVYDFKMVNAGALSKTRSAHWPLVSRLSRVAPSRFPEPRTPRVLMSLKSMSAFGRMFPRPYQLRSATNGYARIGSVPPLPLVSRRCGFTTSATATGNGPSTKAYRGPRPSGVASRHREHDASLYQTDFSRRGCPSCRRRTFEGRSMSLPVSSSVSRRRTQALAAVARSHRSACCCDRYCKMTRAGLEPATYGLKVRCSTN